MKWLYVASGKVIYMFVYACRGTAWKSWPLPANNFMSRYTEYLYIVKYYYIYSEIEISIYNKATYYDSQIPHGSSEMNID